LIGTEAAANSLPDGYTLLLVSLGYAFNASLYKLPYDPATAFAPVALLGAGPAVLVVNSKLPVNSVKELLALAKEKPGQLHYVSGGVGSFQHLTGALFKLQSGADIVHVPFKGAAPAMMDVVAGNTEIAIGTIILMLPQIKAGRLKALGVGSTKRLAFLPDVPTIAEAGVPGFDVSSWFGFFVPVKTPEEIIAKLNADTNAALAHASVKSRFDDLGATPRGTTPGQLAAFLKSEIDKWGPVIRDARIKVEN
jgi:tripartite-type tricarboxylate transporter receptor subunit TctC